MANLERNLSGSLPRLLQLGVDKEIQHFGKDYVGPYKELFTNVACPKGFYEMVEISGIGPAARRNEGQVITNFDGISQDFNPRYTVYSYEKACRASEEAIDDNLYENLVSRFTQVLGSAHEVNKDMQAASILNSATTTTWGDGSALLSTSHALQNGDTNSNRLSPDLDLSADAVQTAIINIQQFKNPNGMLGDYTSQDLVIPTALQFVANVIMNSMYKPGSMANDINSVNSMGLVNKAIVWRRLTSATTWFITTNRNDDNGLILAEKGGVKIKSFQDDWTHDTVVSAKARYRFMVADHRCIAGSVGP